MRLIPWLLLFPLVALAQPDPSPLTPGTFDLTVTEADGTERIVDGWAAVHAYPAALGGWTLVLDDGEDLVAIERATAPDLDGAAFADARDVSDDDDARAYLRLDDLSVGPTATRPAKHQSIIFFEKCSCRRRRSLFGS